MHASPPHRCLQQCSILFALLLPLCAGCSMLPGAKLSACRTEKQQLLARIQQDQDRLAAAEARERIATERLAQAEKSLALLHDGRSDIERLASRPAEEAGSPAPATVSDPAVSDPAVSDRSHGWEARQP